LECGVIETGLRLTQIERGGVLQHHNARRFQSCHHNIE